MSTLVDSTVRRPANEAHASRRRGFAIVSRLARQHEAGGRRAADLRDANEWAIDTRTYEPRHRREDAVPCLWQLRVS